MIVGAEMQILKRLGFNMQVSEALAFWLRLMPSGRPAI